MALHDILLEEVVGLNEDMQGNVGVTGLVYEEEVETTLFTDDPVFIVWVEQVDDGFDITPDFTASHEPYCFIDEGMQITEGVGVPAKIFTSDITVVHPRETAPVQVWWLGLNVIHGPDTFFEEVITNLHATEPTVQAVPYYWESLYESLDVDFNNIEPLPPVTVARKITVEDLVNMRHEVIFDYRFICSCNDGLFIIIRETWGWRHDIDEDLTVLPYASQITGWKADEWLGLIPACDDRAVTQEIIESTAFAWDTTVDGRTFDELLDTLLDAIDAANVGLEMLLSEPLGLVLGLSGQVSLQVDATDALRAADNVAPCWELTIEDGADMAETVSHVFEIYCACQESMDMSPEAIGVLLLLLDVDEEAGVSEGVA